MDKSMKVAKDTNKFKGLRMKGFTKDLYLDMRTSEMLCDYCRMKL